MIVIGIDPGLEGAIAFIGRDGANVEDMPVVDGSVDPAGLAHLLQQPEGPKFFYRAYVERVGSRPKQGVASTFKFGAGYGMVLGVLAAAGIPYTLVTPGTWKKMFHLNGDKDASRARALQLWPALAGDLARKKDHGRAEALLIAEWGRCQQK